MKTIVVAYDKNRGIGANNGLPWQLDLPDDLARFKQLTTGGTIIMGRKTFDSIGRALPGRQNIVVTHNPVEAADVLTAGSLEEAYGLATNDIFIIGGGMIYAQSLADTDVIYATEVAASFPGASVFFPALDASWHETAREHHKADDRNKYDYDFVTYTKS